MHAQPNLNEKKFFLSTNQNPVRRSEDGIALNGPIIQKRDLSHTKTDLNLVICRDKKIKNMKYNIDPAIYEAIGNEIKSEDSPVGIDAKKTHIIIIQKLEMIEAQLKRLEEKFEDMKEKK